MPIQQEAKSIDSPEVIIQSHLAKGEEVLWVGCPDIAQYRQEQMDYVVGACFIAILSILLLAAAVTEIAVLALLPIPHVIALRFKRRIQREDSHLVYALTNKRLIILQAISSVQVKSYRLRKVAKIDVVKKEGGVGTINFFCRILRTVEGEIMESDEQAEFALVPHADEVAAKVRLLMGNF